MGRLSQWDTQIVRRTNPVVQDLEYEQKEFQKYNDEVVGLDKKYYFIN